jgi:ferredoxin
MGLRIDSGLCQGHARCAALAPELFDLDENGFGIVRPGCEDAPADDPQALLAVDNCPEQAIVLEPDSR